MSNVERSHAGSPESKKRRARLLAAVAAAALFGAAPAVAQVRTDVPLRGTVMRVDGNGNTIVVWPRAVARVDGGGNGNIIVVWPRTAARVDGGGNGNTIIVWPMRVAPGVETNDSAADVASLEVRAEANNPALAQLRIDPEPGAAPRRAMATAPAVSVRGSALRVAGSGNTIVVWPRTAPRVDGNGTTVVIWPVAPMGGNGNTVVIWPKAAADGGGGGTTVVVWARAAAPAVETRYPVPDLTSVEVRAGRDRTRGTVIGAGIGTALAALFSRIDGAHRDRSSGRVAGTVAGGAVGGALLGYAFAPRGWRRLPLPGQGDAPGGPAPRP